MIHLGDITKINGAEIPPVDVITGGSPCQDLSVAGKRAGLEGERSGLFMEMIRVIKEMRNATADNDRGPLPRYMVWENVPGAFSSNHGEDFRAVLEETAKVADKTAVIPRPEGKWSNSGAIVGDGWSIAWRVHDAQFWGVPQRRRRIALVADFGGQSAPEILFERKGMRRDPEESGEEGEGTPTDVKGSVDATISCLNDQGGSQMGVTEDVTGTLRAEEHGHQPVVFEPGAASRVGGHVYKDDVAGTVRANAGDNQQAVCYGISSYESNAMKSANPHSGIYEAETARTLDNNGGSPACNQGGMAVVSMATKQLSQNVGDNVAMPICANDYKEPQVVCLEGNGSRPSHQGDGWHEGDPMYTLNSTEHHAVAVENHPADSRVKISEDGVVQTLSSGMGTGGNNVPMVMYPEKTTGSLMASGYDKLGTQEGMNAQFDFAVDVEKIGTQVAKGPGAVCNDYIVRRLTPMECERLQGFPSMGKVVDVSAMTKDEYIAWNLAEGNIIADAKTGKVYATRGPGGCPYKQPKELSGTELNGYRVVSIRNGATKLQCRVHRIIWISQNGILPDGYVIDHINNDKMDNRIENLQLLTPGENSHKAKEDGLYKEGMDNKATKLDPDLKDEIAFLYNCSELTMRDLAEMYGVSKSRIQQIVHEVGWTDIGEWTDSKGKKRDTSDTARYKALGNSIALPYWKVLARRIAAQYDRDITMGSLFDGIGGFPLAFQHCGATPVWASEIEEFCIAVTEKHFPEGETDDT